MKDFFEERVEAKKERVAKNEMQRLKNIARQLNSTVKKVIAFHISNILTFE